MSKPRVLTNIGALNSERANFLKETFRDLASGGAHINVNLRSSANKLFIGISDGIEKGLNFTEWRFQIKREGVKANYHEVWIHIKKDNYFLERSYFHIYYSDENLNEKEYVLLHCDASEPDITPHAKYKQSPHIHIEAAKYPIPKAHIALYNGRVDDVLSNIYNFNVALVECVKLIDDQFIALLN